jgi:predicted O-methyltransferase YrrM
MSALTAHALRLGDQWRKRLRERRVQWDEFIDSDALCDSHFRARSSRDHINFDSLKLALRQLDGAPAVILETGTSAHGTDSTLLFDSYVRSFGGRCITVDLDPVTVNRARKRVSDQTSVYLGDSVAFLQEMSHTELGLVTFLYLDSFDVDFLDPLPAANHCLAEFRACESRLSPGALVLIDDSPASVEWFQTYPAEEYRRIQQEFAASGLIPGKGMLLVPYLVKNGATLLHHDYQALLRI